VQTSERPATAPASRLRQRRGFTIFETAMSAAILAMGIATSIVAMQQGYRAIDVARGTTLASQILQSEIERIRMMSWSAVQALPAEDKFDGATFFSANPDIAGKYTIYRRVEADPDRPSDVYNITLSVTWNSSDGRSHTRSFRSRYVKNGLYDYYYTSASPLT
jgi:Tfp pilus assembly protein PilV